MGILQYCHADDPAASAIDLASLRRDAAVILSAITAEPKEQSKGDIECRSVAASRIVRATS